MPTTFPETVRAAVANRWCVRPWCTTCSNQDFRSALEQLDDGTGERLTAELSNMDLADYVTIQEWDDAVRVAFLSLPWPGQRERVLEAWLARPSAPTRLIDVVLYFIVRHYTDSDLRRRWISVGIQHALATRDGSLTETLLWALGDGISSEPSLAALALELADTYPPVRKPLGKFYGQH